MPNPRDADLPARIARAMAYVARWCERRLAEGVLDPHNYGRAVDALLKGSAASGTPAPEAVVDGLRTVLLDLTDNPLGFPRVDGQTNPHDLREIVQAFTELATARDDRAARERLGTLLDTWIRLTNPDGTWRADLIAAEPSLKHPGFTDERNGIESPAPRSRARSVMALTHLFRLTGDQRALELADRFVRLARTTSFTDDGRLTMQAGAHTHSSPARCTVWRTTGCWSATWTPSSTPAASSTWGWRPPAAASAGRSRASATSACPGAARSTTPAT